MVTSWLDLVSAESLPSSQIRAIIMTGASSYEITQLLHLAWGDQLALERLTPIVYEEFAPHGAALSHGSREGRTHASRRPR